MPGRRYGADWATSALTMHIMAVSHVFGSLSCVRQSNCSVQRHAHCRVSVEAVSNRFTNYFSKTSKDCYSLLNIVATRS